MNGYDLAYGLALGASAPVWLIKGSARRKVLKALRERMGHTPARALDGPAVMIHAVSLGEINATRALVRELAKARSDLRFIISTTTETGSARGREIYGSDPRATLIRYPLDFSPAVGRVLDRLRPDVVVLMELEVWPNFVLHCQRRGIAVVLVNGRLTAGSFRNYRLAAPLVRRTFARLTGVCAQEQVYADRFIALGVPAQRVRVTGTMKFDTAEVADRIPGAEQLADAVGLRPGVETIWVCGSTGPGEEELLLGVYRELLASFPELRLVIVPRKPERFDEVAQLIEREQLPLIRRSECHAPRSQIANRKSQISLILGDTMGELRKFYSLADVVFVGRTLVDSGPRQHGSDMIEPAALAKPVVVGPYTGNFAEVMNCFRSAGAIREASSPEELRREVAALLTDRHSAAQLGRRAQGVVRAQQGSTRRHVDLILGQLSARALNRCR